MLLIMQLMTWNAATITTFLFKCTNFIKNIINGNDAAVQLTENETSSEIHIVDFMTAFTRACYCVFQLNLVKKVF